MQPRLKGTSTALLLIGEEDSLLLQERIAENARLDTPFGICTTPSHRSFLSTCKSLQSGGVHLPRRPCGSIWGARLPFTDARQRPCSDRGGGLKVPLPHHHRLPISHGHELLDNLDARIS